MYIPKHFEQTDKAACHDLIEKFAFGTLISQVNGSPYATHLPFILNRDQGEFGTLLGHVAKANPHWQTFTDGSESLAIFQGPHAYVSPRWYAPPAPAVPTWNYAVVHAYGPPRLIEGTDAIDEILARLTAREESGAKQPWTMDSVDKKFLDGMRRGIATFEIPITRLQGKWKLNQNRPAADRQQVIAALRESDSQDANALAELMRQMDSN